MPHLVIALGECKGGIGNWTGALREYLWVLEMRKKTNISTHLHENKVNLIMLLHRKRKSGKIRLLPYVCA